MTSPARTGLVCEIDVSMETAWMPCVLLANAKALSAIEKVMPP